MDRTPPIHIRRLLRSEVGFGCPVPDCANPYLSYHHFDPPWSAQEHHNPEGMIALCLAHHHMADGGTFTKAQLRHMKRQRAPDGGVGGRLAWLRNELLAIVGGNLYYKTNTILSFGEQQAIWFNRDEDNHLLLNVRMMTLSGRPRLRLEDSDWVVLGEPVDFECPPSGRRILVTYRNGDELVIEFHELAGPSEAAERHPDVPPDRWPRIDFPVTVVEVRCEIGGTGLGFGPTWTKLPGLHLTDGFFVGARTAILIS
jgi:hypothetical protein